jgi:hypothetical protein
MPWFFLRPERRRWWNAPVAALRAVNRLRRVTPAPWLYLSAAAFGSLVGIALDLSLNLPWWLFGLAAAAVVWLAFMLPATLPRRGTRELLTDVLLEVAPAKGHAREERRLHEMLRKPPFPIYGLSRRWSGRRFVGGHGSGMGEGFNSIELAHGDYPFKESEPQVRIRSQRRQFDPPVELRLEEVARSLWGHIHRPPMRISSPGTFDAWSKEDRDAFKHRVVSEAGHVEIPVDGVPRLFHYLDQGPSWGAVAKVNDMTITLDARNVKVEEIELVTISDPEPYIEGSRVLWEGT